MQNISERSQEHFVARESGKASTFLNLQLFSL